MSDIVESYEIYKTNLSEKFKKRYDEFLKFKNDNKKFNLSISKFISEYIFEKFDAEAIAGNLIDKNVNLKYRWVHDDKKYPTREDKIKAILNFWSDSSNLGTNIHNTIENTYMKKKIFEILPNHVNHVYGIEKEITCLEQKLDENRSVKRRRINEIEEKKIENEIICKKQEKYEYSTEILKFLNFLKHNKDNFEIGNIFPEYEVYITEYPVYSFEFNINGRIDAIFLNKKTNKLILVDWKTGDTNNLYVSYNKRCKSNFSDYPSSKYMKFCMQLNLYRILIEKFYDFEVEAMYVVLVDKEKKESQIKVETISEIDELFETQEIFEKFISI